LDDFGTTVWGLHQYLVGLRRRHPWLHGAATTSLQLKNRQYVYTSRSGDDALVIALNIDDQPLRVALSEVGAARAEVLAGSSAPPQEVVDEVTVEPHGWRILQPV
jgi:cyclomaltodextrinase / maltogenic alpha-amylase / neopullulanase